MKNSFIQIANYIESLEQRLAALETRYSEMQTAMQAQDKHETEQTALIAALTAQVANLENQLSAIAAQGVAVPAEPEVEVELVMDEEDEEELPLPIVSDPEDAALFTPQAESLDAPVAETPVEVPAMDMPVVEALETVEEVQEEAAPRVEDTSLFEAQPVVEAPVQPVVETPVQPVVETPVQPVVEAPVQPVAEPVRATVSPMQTSLFGTPVQDIRKAISIGDRFLFQRELFGGNGEAMQKALDRLNACDSLPSAMTLVEQFGWNRESATYELFVNVLRRRFGAQ